MPAAERVNYVYNRLIQYWVPCIEPDRDPDLDLPPDHLSRALSQRIHPSPPLNWPTCVTQPLDIARRTAVGRALVRHIRRITTVYPGRPGSNFTDVDVYFAPDVAGNQDRNIALQRAASRGYDARTRIDFSARAHHNETGLLKTIDTTFVHELAHAVSITNGGYSHAFSRDVAESDRLAMRFQDAFRATSREEAYAWIIENMYRSESRLSIRDSYIGNGATPYAADPTPATTGIPLEEIETMAVFHFRRHVPGLVNELEAIPEHTCSYNPFRRLATLRVPQRSARGGNSRTR